MDVFIMCLISFSFCFLFLLSLHPAKAQDNQTGALYLFFGNYKLCDTLFEQSYQNSTNERKMNDCQRFKKNKRGATNRTSPTHCTTFVFLPTAQLNTINILYNYV